MHKKLTTDGKHLTTDAKSSHGLWTNELIIASPACPMIICITRMLEICQVKFICQNICIGNIINILPLVEGVTVDYHKKKNHPRVIFFMSVVIYLTASTKGSMFYIILNAFRRVVLRDMVYPCNTTLCFGGRG